MRSQSSLGLFERGGPGTDRAFHELRHTLPALAVRDASCMRARKLTLSVYVHVVRHVHLFAEVNISHHLLALLTNRVSEDRITCVS